jgi:hypothetical protein
MRPIIIDSLTRIPCEHLQNPIHLVQELTIENGAWHAGAQSKAKATIPRYFALAQEDTESEYVSVPRAFDASRYLRRGVAESVPVYSDPMDSSWWPKVWLGDGDPVLGPHEQMPYNQTPAWEAMSSDPVWPWGRILGLKCGAGKAMLNSEPVLTPTGWKKIGDAEVGDKVCGSDGKFYNVTGVYPQGRRKLYKLYFTCGTEITCDEEHIWTFDLKRTTKVRREDFTVSELLDLNLKSKAGRKFYLPMVEPIEFPKADLPLDPYLLGALLGDGCLANEKSVHICSLDKKLVESLKLPGECRPKPLKHQHSGKATEYILAPPRKGKSKNELLKELTALGMMGCRSWEKEIPKEYLYAHWEARHALLQGLLDTDGTPVKSNSCDYVTVSEQLAEEIQWLAFSLGGTATLADPVRKSFTHKGEKRLGRPAYRLYIKLPAHLPLFRLKRHLDKLPASRQREPYRALDRIEEAGYGEATCISVDAPDCLYVTKNCVLTHNTVLALKLARLRSVRTLVVCHTLNMARTWSQTAAASWCLGYPQELHGFIGDGQVAWEDKDLVFSSMPGLLCRDYPPEFWTRWGLVIFDEGDLLGASNLQKMLSLFVGERLLVTATLARTDKNDVLYRMHIGDTCFEDTTQDLEPSCYIVDSPTPRMLPKLNKGTKRETLVASEQMVYSSYVGRMVPNIPKTLNFVAEAFPERKEWAMRVVKKMLDEGRKVLFLGERVEALQQYNAQAQAQWDYESGLVLGAQHMPLEECEHNLKTCDVIWAIQQIAKRGLNQPDIDTIVVEWCTFKDEGRWQQTVGRALRHHAGKREPVVILLNDANIGCLDDKAQHAAGYFRKLGYEVNWYEYEDE